MFRISAGGYHIDRQRLQAPVRADLLQDIKPIHKRHIQIKQENVGKGIYEPEFVASQQVIHHLHTVIDRLQLHRDPAVFQASPDERLVIKVIVGDEYSEWLSVHNKNKLNWRCQDSVFRLLISAAVSWCKKTTLLWHRILCILFQTNKMSTGILSGSSASPVTIEKKGFRMTLFPGSPYAEMMIKAHAVFDEAMVRLCRNTLIEGNPGKKYFLLVGSEGFFRVTRQARKLGAGKKYTNHLSAVAFYTSSVSLVLLGELFSKINKPPMLLGIFSSRDPAISWLQEKMDEQTNAAAQPFVSTSTATIKNVIMQTPKEKPLPNEPDKNVPTKPDPNPDPSKKIPERNDPTRIPDPQKNDPTRITPPDPSKPSRP
jgi:hypothetical protein